MWKYSSPKKLAYHGVAVTPGSASCRAQWLISGRHTSLQLPPVRRPATLSLRFGQQQHLLSQLPELSDQALSLASAGQVAHALVCISSFQVAVEHELDAIQVFRSAHQERAAEAKGPRGADRKSTRLNSSHEWISYAVFCL